jgi:hypothetical protein
MIKIDLSKVIPKRLGTYLLGFVPGVVFELTVTFGDPVMAHRMIERVKDVYPFQGYALLALFAASCLVVGQTFFLLAWFTDWTIEFLYRTYWFLILHLTLGSNWLYKAVGRLQGMPPKMYFRHLWRPIMWARGKKIPFEIRPILKCQRMAATQLLKRKFGVTPSTGHWEWVDQEWKAWLAILGKPPAGFRESFLTMRTFLGCGLAELAALYIIPTLQNRYFVTMGSILFLAGCFQSLSFAKVRREPTRAGLARLLALMEELREIRLATSKEDMGASTGAGLTISTDGKDDGDKDE